MSDPPPCDDRSSPDEPADPLEKGMRAAFRPPPDDQDQQAYGLLETLRSLSGPVPRITLSDSREEEAPVLRLTGDGKRQLPERIGRYQVLGEIACGGVGIVLKVRDPDLGRELALKVLLDDHEENPAMVSRFIEEAQVGGQLEHPGIVAIHELGLLSGKRPYFTMKLVKGRTLAALLEDRRDAGEHRQRFLGHFQRICETLAYAHARGVVHRDLKPSNIMVGTFGEIQVMDWGFAKVLARGGAPEDLPEAGSDAPLRTVRTGDDGSGSAAGSVMGTPLYMAPEQARGEVDSIDERTDVFGIGAILCEILTGKPPYSGETASEIQVKARNAMLGDALGRLDSCTADPEVVSLARRCLAVDPEDRPRNAGAVAVELRGYFESLEQRRRELETAAAEARVRAREGRKALQLTLALAVVLVLTLISTGGYLWLKEEQKKRQRAAALAVVSAIEEARRFRDEAAATLGNLSKWDRALQVAKRAASLAMGDLAPGIREQAGDLLETILKDRRMIARLEELRVSHGDDVGWGSREPGYGRAFLTYGIDIDSELSECADKVRESAITRELAAALDDWAQARKRAGHEGWKKLVWIAETADPAPWRSQLRSAFRGERVAELQALAEKPGIRQASAQTLDLLGSSLETAGDTQRAVAVYRLAQELYPDDYWINHNLALLLAEGPTRRAKEEQLRFLTVALALRPRSFHSWFDIGMAAREAGHLGASARAYEKAAELRPERPRVRNLLGNVLYDKGDFEGAVAAYREALRLDSENVDAHTFLGRSLVERGDHENALAHYREAARLKPRNPSLQVNLVWALSRSGHHDEAVAHSREALRRDPDEARLRGILGYALAGAGHLDDAILAYERAIQLDPDSDWNHNHLGYTLSLRGDYERAIEAYRVALRLKPDDAHVWDNLGDAFYKKGDLDDAVTAYREAIRLLPSLAHSYDNLRKALERKGDQGHTVAVYRDLIRVQPENIQLYKDLASALDRQGEYEEAITLIGKAVRLEPQNVSLQRRLADLCYKNGALEEAISICEEALRLDPNSARLNDDLGRALLEKGDLKRGFRAFGASIELLPESTIPYHRLLKFFNRQTKPIPNSAGEELVVVLDRILQSGRKFNPAAGPVFCHALRSWTGHLVRSGRQREAITALENAILLHDSVSSLSAELAEYRAAVLPDLVSYASIDAAVEALALPGPEATSEPGRKIAPREGGEHFAAFRRTAQEAGAKERLLYLDGRLLQRAGRFRDAVSRYRQTAAADPSAFEPALRLAESLRAAGDSARAARELQTALSNGKARYGPLWELWAAVCLGDLGWRPEELLANIAKLESRKPRATEPAPSVWRDDLSWLLGRLKRGLPVRINCGGWQFTGRGGDVWRRDCFYTSGHRAEFSVEIDGADDDPLYRTERWYSRHGRPPCGYRIPLPPGTYEVRLGFAEVFGGARQAGFRIFDVAIEGKPFLSRYEPGAHGFATPDVRSTVVTVEDGLLEIEFLHQSDNPKVSLIEVRAK